MLSSCRDTSCRFFARFSFSRLLSRSKLHRDADCIPLRVNSNAVKLLVITFCFFLVCVYVCVTIIANSESRTSLLPCEKNFTYLQNIAHHCIETEANCMRGAINSSLKTRTRFISLSEQQLVNYSAAQADSRKEHCILFFLTLLRTHSLHFIRLIFNFLCGKPVYKTLYDKYLTASSSPNQTCLSINPTLFNSLSQS